MFHFSQLYSRNLTLVILFGLASLRPFGTALADSATEEKFETVFTSAGYSTALGAGIGAALLAFTADPKKNLGYITTGASVGFLGGAALGSYLVLVVDSGSQTDRLDPMRKAVGQSSPTPTGLQLNWTIAQF